MKRQNYEYSESLDNPDLLSGLTMEGMIALRTRLNLAITLEKRNIKDRLKQQFAEEAWRKRPDHSGDFRNRGARLTPQKRLTRQKSAPEIRQPEFDGHVDRTRAPTSMARCACQCRRHGRGMPDQNRSSGVTINFIGGWILIVLAAYTIFFIAMTGA